MARTLAEMVAAARSQARQVSPDEAAKALDGGAPGLIIDVREAGEFQQRHLPGSTNIPRGMIELRADPASPVANAELVADTSARILVYCTKNPSARSLLAAQTLRSMGYDNVEVLDGGLVAWTEAGLPVESATA
ncbi:MAG TPA: rhodanese-like domain-containing protein [Solirubrobacteraceae bacterium]|jgi:rhodanese-related sulfurtransferase|nr:rhodanese-like domain-containing protein [Solirubrobacteraceae bacterium]